MRTHILIAAALVLSASAAHAGSRSLSGAQTSPVEPPAQKVQILEAPTPKVQVLEAQQAADPPKQQALDQPKQQALDQPKEPIESAEQAIAPAETAPDRAAPIEDKSVAAASAEAAPAASAETSPAPDARPVKQARRKQPRRLATTEQQIERELRNIGRTIERHIGFALSNATLCHW